jgi:NAD-dependent SIR2 family protein deacetylase
VCEGGCFLTNHKGFRAYKLGYVRCTPCGKWLRRDEIVKVDAQGSPVCPFCHTRLRLKRRRALSVGGSLEVSCFG